MPRPLVPVLDDQLSLDLPSLRDLPDDAEVALCEVDAKGQCYIHLAGYREKTP